MEPRTSPSAEVSVRRRLRRAAQASVATGLPVLDHLVGELARSRRHAALARGRARHGRPAEAVAAGRALGEALAEPLRAAGAAGRGFAWLPADEALAGAVLEVSRAAARRLERRFLRPARRRARERRGRAFPERARARAPALNMHIRVLEGKDPQHVLLAIFKALGAAIGQACRHHGQEGAMSEQAGRPHRRGPGAVPGRARTRRRSRRTGSCSSPASSGSSPGAQRARRGRDRPQTEQALANLRAILEAAGSSLDGVVKTTVFLQQPRRLRRR